jgi:tetratricopeptide (TPR) repeat protein
MGAIMAQRDQMDVAAEYLQKAIEIDPELPQAHSNLGNVFYSRGDYKQAEECYRTAIRFDPEDPLYHENLHAALKKQGRYSEAVKELKTSHKRVKAVANEQRDVEVRKLKGKLGCASVISITLLLVAVISLATYIL